MEDLDVGRERPHLFRQRLAELLLDLHRVVALGNADAVRYAQYVTIDRQTGNAQRMSEHDVRRLAADARELRELLHVGRHLAAVFGDQLLRHPDQGFRFLTKESGRQNLRLELGGCGLRQRARISIALEKGGRDHVDARVGGLRGQDCRHQQLERVAVMQLRIGVRVLLRERLDDPPGRLGGFQ